MSIRPNAFFACLALLSCFATILPAAEPAKPFNGKDLAGWKLKGSEGKSKWKVGFASVDPNNPGQLVVKEAAVAEAVPELVNAAGGGVDIYTEQTWGDHKLSVEVMVPKGSNSGVYVLGEYEVQVLDSYGKEKVGPGDIGGLYGAAAPKTNAAKKPGEWQLLEIEFQAPKFEGGKKVANAKFVKVTLNGVVIHENVEMKGPTPSGVTGKEAPTGPVMFQGDHGPVAYRNLQVWAQ